MMKLSFQPTLTRVDSELVSVDRNCNLTVTQHELFELLSPAFIQASDFAIVKVRPITTE